MNWIEGFAYFSERERAIIPSSKCCPRNGAGRFPVQVHLTRWARAVCNTGEFWMATVTVLLFITVPSLKIIST